MKNKSFSLAFGSQIEKRKPVLRLVKSSPLDPMRDPISSRMESRQANINIDVSREGERKRQSHERES